MNLRHVREILYCLKARVKAREAAASAAISRAEAAAAGLQADQITSNNAGQAHDRYHPANRPGLKPLNTAAATNIHAHTQHEDGELSPTSAMVARLAAPSSVGSAVGPPVQLGVDADATDPASSGADSNAGLPPGGSSSTSHAKHEGPPPDR